MDYLRKKCCNFVKIQVWDIKCFVSDSYLICSPYVHRYLNFKWFREVGIFKLWSHCLVRKWELQLTSLLWYRFHFSTSFSTHHASSLTISYLREGIVISCKTHLVCFKEGSGRDSSLNLVSELEWVYFDSNPAQQLSLIAKCDIRWCTCSYLNNWCLLAVYALPACPGTGILLVVRAQHLSMAIIFVICPEQREVGENKPWNKEICEANSCRWDGFSGMFKINITELRIASWSVPKIGHKQLFSAAS